MRLLLDRGVCISMGFEKLENKCMPVFLNNFCNEDQYLAKDTAVELIEKFAEVMRPTTIGTIPSDSSSEGVILLVEFRQNPSAQQKDALFSLAPEPSDFFGMTKTVRQTHAKNHSILTRESARPLLKHLYKVSPKNREEIKNEIEVLLSEDVIQPSKSA